MTSERKIAANQNNAQKSTGPSSKAGREISRRNSLRHGLAIDIGADPTFHDAIQKLAKVLSPRKRSTKMPGKLRQHNSICCGSGEPGLGYLKHSALRNPPPQIA
jgi:hypothetical protein